MFSYKKPLIIILLIIVLALILLGSMDVEKSLYANQEQTESRGTLHSVTSRKDTPIDLLGKTFDEVMQVLGKPDEEGFSIWLGPHHYILYGTGEGYVRFCSPASLENNTVISIIIGPGQEIHGAKAGMLFSEIMDVLGPPDLGPELGLNNLYYMDYYFGERNNQVPEIFISFSSVDLNKPTRNIFIKWEAHEYEQKEQQMEICNITSAL